MTPVRLSRPHPEIIRLEPRPRPNFDYPSARPDAPSRLSVRDLAILLALDQHRCLTTEHLTTLFFPSLRSARKGLRRLADGRLLISVPRVDVSRHAWQHRSSFHVLSTRGAVLLADRLEIETVTLARRPWPWEPYTLNVDVNRDLPVNDFFVSMVAASRGLPGHGLYHWIGTDTLRREYQLPADPLSAYAWGRYLVPGGELRFFLEHDPGFQPPERFTLNTLAQVARLWRHPAGAGSHVLIVTPDPAREGRIRRAVRRATPSAYLTRIWTANTGLLEEAGIVGPIWHPLGARDRLPLIALPTRPDGGYVVEDCIGKPGWWERRPGGGEGA